ncbi:MAG: hypothetical protein AAFY28_02150 [Actinomycetota bacterium]
MSVSTLPPTGFFTHVGDVVAVTQRELLAYRRDRSLLIATLALPTLALIVFDGVLGGSLQDSLPSSYDALGIDYVDYVLPGLMVILAAYGAREAAQSIALDAATGQLERYRSLPVSTEIGSTGSER